LFMTEELVPCHAQNWTDDGKDSFRCFSKGE